MAKTFQTRPVRAAPPSVARVSAAVFAALAKKTKFADPTLVDRWPEIAGPEIADLCRPGRLIGGRSGKTLEVYAASGAAATQAQMLAEDLISRVNRFLGPNVVARIAIRQRGAGRPSPAATAARSPLDQALASFRTAVNRRNGEK